MSDIINFILWKMLTVKISFVIHNNRYDSRSIYATEYVNFSGKMLVLNVCLI